MGDEIDPSRPQYIEDKRRSPYGSNPIVLPDGSMSKERIHSSEIERVIESRVIEQNSMATRWNHRVKLKDGREVTIRDVEIEGLG